MDGSLPSSVRRRKSRSRKSNIADSKRRFEKERRERQDQGSADQPEGDNDDDAMGEEFEDEDIGTGREEEDAFGTMDLSKKSNRDSSSNYHHPESLSSRSRKPLSGADNSKGACSTGDVNNGRNHSSSSSSPASIIASGHEKENCGLPKLPFIPTGLPLDNNSFRDNTENNPLRHLESLSMGSFSGLTGSTTGSSITHNMHFNLFPGSPALSFHAPGLGLGRPDIPMNELNDRKVKKESNSESHSNRERNRSEERDISSGHQHHRSSKLSSST